MAHIDALIDKVADPSLRQELREQIDVMLNKQSFGLVFQAHKPETVQLPNFQIRRHCKVTLRTDVASDPTMYEVVSINGGRATIRTVDEAAEETEVAIAEIVVVREFGEPIFPGLRSVGKVDRGGDKPRHVVLNAENFHALEMLLYTHEEKVDAIYIDPPYNSGARTWKYNNDYVDGVDKYRHSKWLSFMEKRLRLAKRLLRPECSVLIVTIDENEVHRLALLLDQVFKDTNYRIQMVTSVINPKGASLGGDFARVEEHIFYVYVGAAAVVDGFSDMLNADANRGKPVKWSSLIRGGAQGIRTDSPGAYYPVFVDPIKNIVHSFGAPLPWGNSRESVKAPKGTVAVWPPTHTSGAEGRWGIGPEKAAELYEMGALRLGTVNVDAGKFPMSYLSSGIVDKIASGDIVVTGKRPDGALIVRNAEDLVPVSPRTVWRVPSHNAGEYGSKVITSLLPGRRFPFPKALYAVEDTLRFFIGNNPDAVVVDFFGGSGTTTHAVARLNRQDQGRRQSILVTNNEVSVTEETDLRERGLFPGDPEWEALGIANHITMPRIKAAFTGLTPDGTPVEGEYSFVDDGPMSDGFPENAEFFELTYEDPDTISLGRRFAVISPILWLKAGGVGSRIEVPAEDWSLPADAIYGILFDTNTWRGFVDAVIARLDVTHVYIVTDSEAAFQQILSELPTHIECTQLYSDYLHNFEVNTKGNV